MILYYCIIIIALLWIDDRLSTRARFVAFLRVKTATTTEKAAPPQGKWQKKQVAVWRMQLIGQQQRPMLVCPTLEEANADIKDKSA